MDDHPINTSYLFEVSRAVFNFANKIFLSK